jgi:hypothetical protein
VTGSEWTLQAPTTSFDTCLADFQPETDGPIDATITMTVTVPDETE